MNFLYQHKFAISFVLAFLLVVAYHYKYYVTVKKESDTKELNVAEPDYKTYGIMFFAIAGVTYAGLYFTESSKEDPFDHIVDGEPDF